MPRSDRHHAMLEAMGLRVFEARRQAEPTAHSPSPTPPTQATRVAAAPAQVAVAWQAPRDSDAAMHTMAWPALQSAVASCRACALCDSRTQTVFGAGHARADWMVVGDAPGDAEDRSGEPMAGPAGVLLDAMLASLKLTRGEDGLGQDARRRVYVANAVKCRPPRLRNPSTDEVMQCAPYLQRQIELVNPRVIVAMGRYAVLSLLNSDEAIGQLRGKVYTAHGRPVVVTYPPSYLLRNPIDKARTWEDLCLAASLEAQAP